MNSWSTGSPLTVFNGASGKWAHPVDMALKLFNALMKHHKIGVSLGSSKEDKSANISVFVSNGSDEYPFGNDTVILKVPEGAVHGITHTFADGGPIKKAVIFVPKEPKVQAGLYGGKMHYENVSADARAAIVAHEFIHACGLDDNSDHDKVSGLFVAQLQPQGGKILEFGSNAAPMPPLRLGGDTLHQLLQLWP
jgi:hypothetical protein